MTLPTRTLVDDPTEHLADHNVLHAGFNSVIDVKAEYGVTVDGQTDNTAVIQEALDDASAMKGSAGEPSYPGAGPTVYLRSAAWRISDTLTWGSASILGDGPFNTYLIWDGAEGGTAVERAAGTTQWMRGIRFQDGTAKPGCWLDSSASGSEDYGDWIDDVFFNNWSPTLGVAALITAPTLNCHLSRLRFGGGGGYAIIAKSGGWGGFHLTDFTIDAGAAGDGFKGFLNVNKQNAPLNTPFVHLENGRIETTALTWAAPAGLVVIDSTPANDLGVLPAAIHLEDIDWQVAGSQTTSIVYQDTIQTGCGSHVTIQNMKVDGVDQVLGGLWSSEVIQPSMTSGVITYLSTGRNNSGASLPAKKGWWMQQLDVGRALGLPVWTNATRPAASVVQIGTAIYNTDDNAPNVSDGTNWRDAMGTIT